MENDNSFLYLDVLGSKDETNFSTSLLKKYSLTGL